MICVPLEEGTGDSGSLTFSGMCSRLHPLVHRVRTSSLACVGVKVSGPRFLTVCGVCGRVRLVRGEGSDPPSLLTGSVLHVFGTGFSVKGVVASVSADLKKRKHASYMR